MRFTSLVGFVVVVAVLASSPAQAQRRRQTPQTPQAPQTPPSTTTPTTPPGQPEAASRDQEARMLFEAGRVAYAAGRFEDSLGYFQRAHEMSGRAVLLYNVASAADKLRRDAVALDAFRRYLEAVPTAENRAEVESRIHVLEGVVAAEQARVVPTVTVPTDPALTPALSPEGRGGGGADDAQRNGEVAASLQVGVGAGDDGARDDRGSGIFGQWWFWTIVGVVVVGGTVAAILAATSGGGLGPFQTGDDGRVYMTLGMP